jgi:hypothetical protein
MNYESGEKKRCPPLAIAGDIVSHCSLYRYVYRLSFIVARETAVAKLLAVARETAVAKLLAVARETAVAKFHQPDEFRPVTILVNSL